MQQGATHVDKETRETASSTAVAGTFPAADALLGPHLQGMLRPGHGSDQGRRIGCVARPPPGP